MQESNSHLVNPTAVLAMLNVSEDSPYDCPKQELAAVLHHELQAPLPLALGNYAAEARTALKEYSNNGSDSESLQTLLLQPQPLPGILKVIKRFAKSCSLEGTQDGLPREIALLLYFLSIALARTRCQTRLSDLPDEAVVHGLTWMLGQSWVDEPIRSLANEALKGLGQSNGSVEQ
jgi:hypothetical protein